MSMTEENPPGEIVRTVVEKVLDSELVNAVVAFGTGLDGDDLIPLFIENKDDVRRISFVSYYPSNLTRLLKDYGNKKKKYALVVRACDARGLIELAKRNQVNRDNIYLIGIECSGVADPNTIKGKDGDVYISADEMLLGSDQKPIDINLIRENCRRCEYPLPTMADISCKITRDGTTVSVYTPKGEQIVAAAGIEAEKITDLPINALAGRAQEWQEKQFSALRQLGAEKRLAYWLKQFDKCIKCYGCRNVCPVCYCKDCVLGPTRIVVKRGEYPPERMFHLTRLAHIGDSCVNCGMCTAVCPMQIPLSKLYHMLNKELSVIFNYESGMDLDAPAPLGCFSEQEATMGGVNLD